MRESPPVRHGTADGCLHSYNNPYPYKTTAWELYNSAFIEARLKMMEADNASH